MPTLIASLDCVAGIVSPGLPQLTPAEAQARGRASTSPGVDMQNSYVSPGGGASPVEWQQLWLREEARESAWFSD